MGIVIEIVFFIAVVFSMIWAGIKHTTSTIASGVKAKFDERERKFKDQNKPSQSFISAKHPLLKLQGYYYINRTEDDLSCTQLLMFGPRYVVMFNYYPPIDNFHTQMLKEIEYELRRQLYPNPVIEDNRHVAATYEIDGEDILFTLPMSTDLFNNIYGLQIEDGFHYHYKCLVTNSELIVSTSITDNYGRPIYEPPGFERYRHTGIVE